MEIRIEIPNFIRVVEMSKKQKPQYFEWNGTFIKGKNKILPIKFFKDKASINDKPTLKDLKKQYILGELVKGDIINVWGASFLNIPISKSKIILCEVDSKFTITPIIRNPKKVGTPRTYLIKGQDIYNGFLDPFSRGKVMDAIKECYYKEVSKIPVIKDYPIKIEVEFHHTIHNPFDRKGVDRLGQQWDIDNFVYPYMKAFPDLLVQLGKIKNDDRLHLTQPPHVKFFPIDDIKDMKFVFIISKDDRPEIVENEVFKSYHKNKETFETEDNDLVNDEPFGTTLTNQNLKESLKETFDNLPTGFENG